MKVYKLTDANGQTHGGTQWGEGVTHKATGKGKELCSDGYIHAYEHPNLAALLNPIHGNFTNPRLWECEAKGTPKRDGQLKLGAKTMTTIREIPLPVYTTEQRIAFAIYCGQAVCKHAAWNLWAERWLDGTDRSAAAAARAAEEAAAWAERAARVAARAARVAAEAAAREAAAREAAARVAARAAEAAAALAAARIDLIALSIQALAFEAVSTEVAEAEEQAEVSS
jgi:hypothetical protein